MVGPRRVRQSHPLGRTLGSSFSHAEKTWKVTAGFVLGWEAAAALTKSSKRHGLTDFEIPFITEVVRQLPRPARFVTTAVIACVLHDHFDTRKMFG